jgi:hypothetical protein
MPPCEVRSGNVLRFLVALLVLLGGVPLCVDLLLRVIDIRRHAPEDPIWLALGLLLGLALIFFKRPNWLLHTALHEACHWLACLALGVRVHRVMASDGRGGEVEHAQTGPVRTTLIALAPYTVPLVLGPLLLARALTAEGWARSLLTALAAIAYLAHLTGLVHNIRLNLRDPKGDLAKAGRPLALVVILCGAILVTALTIAVLWDDTWRPLHRHRVPTIEPRPATP